MPPMALTASTLSELDLLVAWSGEKSPPLASASARLPTVCRFRSRDLWLEPGDDPVLAGLACRGDLWKKNKKSKEREQLHKPMVTLGRPRRCERAQCVFVN
jgi:hypothetical protein